MCRGQVNGPNLTMRCISRRQSRCYLETPSKASTFENKYSLYPRGISVVDEFLQLPNLICPTITVSLNNFAQFIRIF